MLPAGGGGKGRPGVTTRRPAAGWNNDGLGGAQHYRSRTLPGAPCSAVSLPIMGLLLPIPAIRIPELRVKAFSKGGRDIAHHSQRWILHIQSEKEN